MSKWDKLRERILAGRSDANISFDDASEFLQRLGYKMTVRGSHHVFKQPGWPALNLQPMGHHVKPYQLKQIRLALLAKGYEH